MLTQSGQRANLGKRADCPMAQGPICICQLCRLALLLKGQSPFVKAWLWRIQRANMNFSGLLIGGNILVRLLKLNDTVIVMIGALSHSAARVFFILGNSPQWLYGGAVMASLGPVVASVLRSFVSKLVPSSDRGKVSLFC